MSARSSPISPVTTATSSTISWRKCSRASPPTSAGSCSRPRSSSSSPARSATRSPDASDGKATLVALERANLFLVPLDDKRQWYRYHHLFADVLRAHLAQERGEEVTELHRRASTWFAANGDTSRAVTHALAAGDVDAAADLMERALPVVQRERREGELARLGRGAT